MDSKFKFSYEADIVVCGAGTAGSIAAIAAANEGKTVALIEQFGAVGGTSTLGLVTPLMKTGVESNPMCSYVGQEVNAKIVEYGGGTGDGSAFDPKILSLVLEELLIRDNIKVFYHTFICDVLREGSSIEGIVVQNKSGKGIIKGKAYIDATGDGDVSYLAGAEFESGDEETGKNQPVSLRYMIGGVDMKKFRQFLAEYGHTAENISTAMTLPNRDWPLYPVFMEAVENGDLTEEDAIYWQIFGVPGRRDTIAFNCPEFFDATNAVDHEDLAYVQLNGKKAILRQLRFYKKYMSGFENAYISDIAAMVGIRESRRIMTEYFLKAEDILKHQKFDDGIVQSNYPIDIHGKKLRLEYNPGDEVNGDNRPFYEIPYRSLVVKGIDNLLVAGRCIGADFVAQSSVRIIVTCRSMGEACGIAASMSIDNDVKLSEVDGSKVREYMIKKGAEFA